MPQDTESPNNAAPEAPPKPKRPLSKKQEEALAAGRAKRAARSRVTPSDSDGDTSPTPPPEPTRRRRRARQTKEADATSLEETSWMSKWWWIGGVLVMLRFVLKYLSEMSMSVDTERPPATLPVDASNTGMATHHQTLDEYDNPLEVEQGGPPVLAREMPPPPARASTGPRLLRTDGFGFQ